MHTESSLYLHFRIPSKYWTGQAGHGKVLNRAGRARKSTEQGRQGKEKYWTGQAGHGKGQYVEKYLSCKNSLSIFM